MVDVTMLDNANEIAQEEIMNEDNVTKEDLKGYRKRLNQLLDVLEDECSDEDEEDEDGD